MTMIPDEIASIASDVAIALVPLAGLFLLVHAFLLRLPRRQVTDILTGTAMAAAGLFLFLLGVHVGFLPFGRVMGEALGKMDETWLLVVAGLFLGFFTTWGEPAVRILADPVEGASGGAIRKPMVLYAICLGVAAAVALGLLRIKYAIPLLYLLAPGYVLVIGLMWCVDRDYLAVAVDAGGVATGPLANTFLLALALGASASRGDQEPIVHGLGLVAIIAMAPIVSVMILGLLIHRRSG